MRDNPLKFVLLVGDLVAIILAFRLAYWVRDLMGPYVPKVGTTTFAAYWPAILLALGLWIILFAAFNLERYYFGLDAPLALSRLLMSLFVFMSLLLAGSYLAKTYYSRLMLISLPVLLLLLWFFVRLAYQRTIEWLKGYGFGMRRVVIVGHSDLAMELAERIRRHPEFHYQLVGFLQPGTGRTTAEMPGHLGGQSSDMAQELSAMRVDEIIFTIPIRRDTEILNFIASCQGQGIQVKLIPEYYELHTSQIESFSIDGIPILEIRPTTVKTVFTVLKNGVDYLGATLLLLLFSPLFLVITVALALLQKGRVLRRELRVGKGGRPFVMYGFDVSDLRSASEGNGGWRPWLAERLHRYSLTELPQLWNVLKGEMSLVGPRPETPERVRHYSEWHKRRLDLKPGITGLAQVMGLRGFHSSDLKTKYDLEYAATFSPMLDLTLMLATVNTLLKRGRQGAAGPEESAAPAWSKTSLSLNGQGQHPRL